MARGPDPSALDRAAVPVLDLVEDFDRRSRVGEHALLAEAEAALASSA